MRAFLFNTDTAIHAVLYILAQLKKKGISADFIRIFKILYFADREHLLKYGRTITGDVYIAMRQGPVPSIIYDIFKVLRDGPNPFSQAPLLDNYFKVSDKYFVEALRDYDLDFLSQTDINELNEAISKYAQIDSARLSEISHGSAWKNTYADSPMSFADILKEIGADEDYIEYINSNFATQKAILNGVSAGC